MSWRKAAIVGSIIGIFLLGGVGWAKIPRGKVRITVRKFCSAQPEDSTCQKIKETRKKIGAILKEMRQEREELCKKYPEEPFCQHVKEIKILRRQEREYLKELRSKIRAECAKNPSANFCPSK